MWLFGALQTASGQSGGSGSQRYFRMLDESLGLASNEVWAAHRDTTGVLWLATSGGLQAWRGERTVPPGLTVQSSDLPRDHVNALVPVPDGLLLGTAGGGVVLVDPFSSLVSPVPTGPSCGDSHSPPTQIHSLVKLDQGSVLIGGREALWIYEDGRICPIPTASESDFRRLRILTDAVLDESGELWLGTWSRGLFRSRWANGTLAPLDSVALPNARIRDLTFDQDGKLWVATSGAGVTRYDPQTGAQDRISSLSSNGVHLPETRANTLLIVDDALYIGSYGGLSVLNLETLEVENIIPDGSSTGLCDRMVARLYDDGFGLVWALTDLGICSFSPSISGVSRGTGGAEVRALSGDLPTQTIWVGTTQSVEVRSASSLVTTRRHPLPPSSGSRPPEVTSIMASPTGVLVGTARHGVLQWRSGRWVEVAQTGDSAVTGLVGLDAGTTVTTAGAGVLRIPAGQRGLVVPSGALPRFSFDAATSDGSDLWIANAQGGVYHLPSGDSASHVLPFWTEMNRSPNFEVAVDLTWSADARLWAAADGGVLMFDPETEKTVTHVAGAGLPVGRVVATTWHDGQVWAATEDAVSRLDESRNRWETFYLPPPLESDPIIRKGLVSVGSSLIVATEHGLWSVDHVATPVRTPEPSINFDSIVPTPDGRLVLPRGSEELTVAIALADLAHPERTRLSLHVEGRDEARIESVGTVLSHRYSDLEPRSTPYRLRITALSSSGSHHDLSYNLEVRPRLRDTWWVQLAALLAIAGGVTGGLVTRVRRRKREGVEIQTALAESREDERQLLSRHIHDGPLQTLYSIGHRIELIEEEPEPAGFEDLRKRNEAAIEALRRICANLRPSGMGQLALDRTIGSYCSDFQSDHPDLSVEAELETVGTMSEATVVCVYRVLQSALANVVRHAQATRVSVTLGARDRNLVLTVADDGVGFHRDTSKLALARGRHFGLLGMREWAERANGTLHIASEPGRGTTLTLSIPIA